MGVLYAVPRKRFNDVSAGVFFIVFLQKEC